MLLATPCFSVVSSTIHWEIRATRTNINNGGGFNAAATGTDYSQQDSTHSYHTDLDIQTNNAMITSATHPFTADDVGNIINITAGTNFTTGRYEILSVSESTATLDRSCGTAEATGGTGLIGGAMGWITDLGGGSQPSPWWVPGNTFWVKAGTYTHTSYYSNVITAVSTAPVYVIGYNTTRGDNPEGNARPFIRSDSGYRYWLTSGYLRFYNIETMSKGYVALWYAQGENYYFNNCTFRFGDGDNAAVPVAPQSTYIKCSFIGAGNRISEIPIGYTIYRFISCYFENFDTAIKQDGGNSDRNLFIGNVFNNCNIGIKTYNYDYNTIINNTFYNVDQPFDGGTGSNHFIYGNIVSSSTYGFSFSTSVMHINKSIVGGNNFWNCTSSYTGISPTFYRDAYDRFGDTLLDPQFTDTATNDFSVGTNMKAANKLGGTPPYVGYTNYLDLGAVQRLEQETGSTITNKRTQCGVWIE